VVAGAAAVADAGRGTAAEVAQALEVCRPEALAPAGGAAMKAQRRRAAAAVAAACVAPLAEGVLCAAVAEVPTVG
jgi:hypothetical protein